MQSMSKLALFGGRPVLDQKLPFYNSIGQEELDAVVQVLRSGCLSGFYGNWGDEFFGGPKVKELESAWSKRFEIKHSISVNSATSGLYAAMGAIGLNPGDEVIVPPYTMSATAMAPLLYGGIPIFVDIDPNTFCLDPQAVRQAITPKTRAIIAVNLFGHPAPLHELKTIAAEHDLKLIEDNAQGPLATEYGQYCGTIGDIGVFSLNYHKHIHTGEGGICVTHDDDLAQRLQLIRNHAENIVEPLNIKNINGMIGFNYRMTELSATIGVQQLKTINKHVKKREETAQKLTQGLQGLEGLETPQVRDKCRHVYYLWSLRFDADTVGVSRERFSRALAAEGFPHFNGYVRPLYLLPMFQQKIVFGNNGYPFNLSNVSYKKGLCPVTERMHEKELMCYEICMYDIDENHIRLLIDALHKVYEHRKEL